jgi:hypothetical protein
MPPTNNTPPLDCFPVAYLSERVSARLLFVLLFAPAVLPAQSVVNPPPGAADDKETLVMSPFILSENKDVGYRSTNSLGGSRLNTDYKDIASRLEVMTPDFLNDIGAFTVEQAFNMSMIHGSPTMAGRIRYRFPSPYGCRIPSASNSR